VNKGGINNHCARTKPFSGRMVDFRLDGVGIFPAPYGRGMKVRRGAEVGGISSPSHWRPRHAERDSKSIGRQQWQSPGRAGPVLGHVRLNQ
jgi:hypothetical protein